MVKSTLQCSRTGRSRQLPDVEEDVTRLKTPTIEIRCKIKVYKFEETHCNTLLKKRKKDKTPTIQLGCKINVYYDDDFQQSAQTGTLSHKSLKNGLTHFNINNNNKKLEQLEEFYNST